MPLTGFLVNQQHTTVCAPDSAAAIIALGGRFPYVGGSQPVLCNLENSVFVSPATFQNTILCHDLTGNMEYIKTHNLVLARCDPAVSTEFFMDGMTMGWGVVSAMAAAASVIFIKKAFFR